MQVGLVSWRPHGSWFVSTRYAVHGRASVCAPGIISVKRSCIRTPHPNMPTSRVRNPTYENPGRDVKSQTGLFFKALSQGQLCHLTGLLIQGPFNLVFFLLRHPCWELLHMDCAYHCMHMYTHTHTHTHTHTPGTGPECLLASHPLLSTRGHWPDHLSQRQEKSHGRTTLPSPITSLPEKVPGCLLSLLWGFSVV